MCMEDVRIGRKTQPRETVVTVAITDTELVKPDATRVHLRISAAPSPGNDLWITTGPLALNGTGMKLQATMEPMQLDIKDDGILVQMGFRATTTLGPDPITIWETLLLEQ